MGPAFSERFDGELAIYGIGVQGRARPGQSRALANAIVDVGGSVVEVQEGSEVREETESIQRAVDFERNALLLFALVTLLTAAALVGQIISRQAVIDLDDDDVLRAAGLRRRERATVPLPRAVLIAVLGGAGAAVIAAGASGIFPVGLARRAELDPGFRPDGACIAVGVLLLVVAVLVPAAAAAWRGTAGAARGGGARRSPRVSTAAAAAAGVGAPVPTVAGVRMALERGRGRTAVPVTGAIVATTAGVLTVTALLVLATSIDRMVDTPALQGWTWDTTVGNLNDPESVEATIDALAANPLVASFIGFSSGPLVIDGEASYAGALGRGDPSAGPEVIEGRMPRAVDEVVVGRLTLADLDKEIGDLVELSPAADAPAQTARIVGTAILPAALDPSLTLGRGVLLTGAGVSRVYGDPRFVPNTFLVRFTEGTTTAEGVRSLQEDFPETAGGLGLADDAVNLSRVQGLPRLLAALVALLGLGTLTNTLATSVRRHRRDLATLSALGMRRRQLGTTVAWQATTFAAVALVVGVPLGIALGRTAWRLLIESLGAVAEPSVPVPSLLVVIVGSVVTANVVAALPARSAARTRPAAVLHAE